MKVPFARQRVVSSSALQMVDRSIVTSELNLDRDVGVQVFSKNLLGTGKLGYALGLFRGEGRNRLGRRIGALYTARIEGWPLGAFDDFVEADIRRDRPLRVAVGANIGYNQHTNRLRSTIGDTFPAGDFNYTHAAVDAMVKWRGWSVSSEWMLRFADVDGRTVLVGNTPARIFSRSGHGVYLQGGKMVTPRIELTSRVGRLSPRDGTAAAFERPSEVVGGIGFYPREHNLKLQADYFTVNTGTPNRRTHQVRTQFQLFF